jgi:hypothetical protein
MTPLVAIDPSAGVSAITDSIAGAVNDNQVEVLSIAGGLLALGVVVRLVKKFAK